MRTLLVIGIGAGDPQQLTVQAVNALNRVDVFFAVDKGRAGDDLARIRREICAQYVTSAQHRFVDIRDPKRDRTAPAYAEAVDAWRRERATVWQRAIAREPDDGRCGGFLVWGDPALYDGTIDILRHIAERAEPPIIYDVIPGISSVQALAARHRVPLNRVGGAVQITTGRRLARGFPREADDVVVVLDADCTFRKFIDEDLDIYWGAYLGTPDEILVSGPIRDCADEIARVRAEARSRKGWIFDTYLLRRR
jgi:precorrin-6A synthase